MKKFMKSLMIIFVFGSLMLVGCGNTENKEESSKSENFIEKQNIQSKDKVDIIINTASLKEKGNYQEIVVDYTINNNSEKTYNYSPLGWEGYLKDGYKLETEIDFQDLDLKQVPSHSSKNESIVFTADSNINIEKFEATYFFFDYNEEFWVDFGKALYGEITEDEYSKKYKNLTNTPLKFNISVEKDINDISINNIDRTIIDNEDLKFVIKSIDPEGDWGYTLNTYIENKNNFPIMVTWEDVSINGFMCDPYWADSIDSNKKLNSEISWSEENFADNNINIPKEITFTLRVYDDTNWEDILNETYTIKI